MDLLNMENNTKMGVEAEVFGKRETFLLNNFCEGELALLEDKYAERGQRKQLTLTE